MLVVCGLGTNIASRLMRVVFPHPMTGLRIDKIGLIPNESKMNVRKIHKAMVSAAPVGRTINRSIVVVSDSTNAAPSTGSSDGNISSKVMSLPWPGFLFVPFAVRAAFTAGSKNYPNSHPVPIIIGSG